MFLPYAVEDNIERKKNWVKCCLKWKLKYYKQRKREQSAESRFISRFIYRNVIPFCKLLIILCGFYMKNNNSYTAHFVHVSFVYSILTFI
jgi:hypothetical protein